MRYEDARAVAQRDANRTGLDHSVELNEMFGYYVVRSLPCRASRCGSELRCEVVHCEDLTRCASGHGPMGAK